MIRFLLADLRGSMANRSLWVFCASLFLGIVLISACSALLQLVRAGLDGQARELFGGDAQVSTRAPIDDASFAWLQDNGEMSLLTELRTMVGTADGAFTVIELQSVDEAYPLYGQVRLAPGMALNDAVAQDADGVWGAAFDPALAVELGIAPGDRITLGELEVELRAAIVEQPDRSLQADVRGPPILIDADAMRASGLAGPMSVVDFDYRVRLPPGADIGAWRDDLRAAFPTAGWEVRTIEERGELVVERLDQVASVLLLIGFATLLIGGLGVANGMRAWLELKRPTLGTLQALGARRAQVVLVFVGQSVIMAAGAAGAGALVGALIAWFAGAALARRLPIDVGPLDLFAPTLLVWLFGVLAALAFALPSLGRALSRRPAQLLRSGALDIGDGTPSGRPLPRGYVVATLLCTLAGAALLLVLVPQPLVGIAFLVVALLLFAALRGIARLIELAARRVARLPALQHRFVLRHAIDGLSRPGSALRPMLLSLGISLTVLSASSLVIASLNRTLLDSVPARAPALVFHDIQDGELDAFNEMVAALDDIDEVVTAPLVLGRLRAVNGKILAESTDSERAFEANDEHKLSRRVPGIDSTTVTRGAWWPDDYSGPPLAAMEDREADQLGLQVGDALQFALQGKTLEATLAAIYEQATLETRFWFEAVFSPGVIEPFVTRHVGSAWLRDGTQPQADVQATNAIGKSFPTVVSIRTQRALDSARSILSAASLAVTLVAVVSLLASVLVMTSVVAVNRHQRTFEATVLHAIGARMNRLLAATVLEYALMGIVVVVFATLVGGGLGHLLLVRWIELPSAGARLAAPATATVAAVLCLGGAAWWLAHGLKATPASLLRGGG